MKRYFIEEAKCGVESYGPDGVVAAAVRYSDGKKTRWLSMAEVEGILNCFVSDRDIYDTLLDNDPDGEALDKYQADSFNGLELGDYDDVFAAISEDPDNPAAPLIRYAIALVRCSAEELQGLIDMGQGRYADELDIPRSDIEEEYEEDLEEEDEGD